MIEIAVVIVIAAFMIAFFMGLSSSVVNQQRFATTRNRLAGIDAALVQYVMQQKRLPCPALGTGSVGTENNRTSTGCGDQTNGVTPWIELGLTETDITDGWGRRITYRVDAMLAANNKMDMSKCDPAGNSATLCTTLVGVPSACNVAAGLCYTTCTASNITSQCTTPSTYLSGRGLAIQTVAGTTIASTGTPNTAAAYVLISHGETGGGGYLSTGQLFTSTTTDGTQEAKNYASLALQSYYVDDEISDVATGTTHFDDIVLRPSLLSVINRAGLGPRSHN